jgi:hypothetical protein
MPSNTPLCDETFSRSPTKNRVWPAVAALVTALLTTIATAPTRADPPIVLAQGGAHNPTGAPPADAATPAQRMQRRYPQPVRVGDLIGLRVLDDEDVTLGRVREVVRGPDGKISLIVTYGGWFGIGTRLVAVPIEAVAILGRQIAALDMPPSEFAAAPTWADAGAQPLPPDEMIKIAITRR